MIKRLMGFLETNVAAFLATCLAVFLVLANTVPLYFFITLLNGVFVGTMIGVTVAYGGLFFDAFFGRKRYGKGMQPDVRQFALAFLGTWAAYGLSVLGSVYVRAADLPSASLMITAVSRYIAVIAAIGQITAPGYGMPMWAGRDRKVLWVAMVVGLTVASATVVFQETNALAEETGRLMIWRG